MKILKKSRSASINSKFTGSYKKKCKLCERFVCAFEAESSSAVNVNKLEIAALAAILLFCTLYLKHGRQQRGGRGAVATLDFHTWY